METLVGAMTGRATQFVPNAIANTHAATQQVLHALDTRFAVHTSHTDGATTIQLDAKEPVPFRVLIGEGNAAQWSTGIKSVVNDAREVSLPMQGVSFSGSPLLETLTQALDDHALLTISPIGRPAVVKLVSGVPGVSLDDLHGQVTTGHNALRFKGSLYASLIKFELSIQRSGDNIVNPEITVGFELAQWHRKPLAELAYLNKVLGIVTALAEAASFRVELEIEGNTVLHATKLNIHESEYFRSVATTVHYIRRAKTLAAFCSVQLTVDLECAFSAEEHRQLADAVDVIEGRKAYGPEAFPTPPEATVVFNDLSDLERMIQNFQSMIYKIVQPSQTIRVFGTDIQLPPLEILFQNSRVRIASMEKMTGMSAAVLQFEPTPEFRCIFQFGSTNP